ncbi:MAG: hypothetical protein ABFR89_11655 [Actinomycetota bacterium]
MAARRLTVSRMAGIAAWTTASVTWSTAIVALANSPQAPVEPATPEDVALPPPVELEQVVLEALPTMPESGLVVLRYAAAERPEAQVIVRRVVSSSSSSAAPRSAAPTREKSSGS